MMKAAIFGTALIALSAGVAVSDQPGPDWMSADAVLKILNNEGYSAVTELEADDGHWEADATKDGKVYELHIDPKTGKLTKVELKK
ncbi:peptidase [Afipia sp. Root123D2]|uniref:PepSY domain-containing protein n=1 Tax=Afipia sp. Root123D2 TaxID=1736436 RepID=UPI0006F4A905|nr:PepSY domain-containing protein [Afipia sp. Root123D2]KQW22454.1 peptidase [Afipia sp. Root123D2]